MGTRFLGVADLGRHPAAVARALPSWRRGDAAEAVAETLQVAAASSFTRSYTAWVWTGAEPGGGPAWILPVTSVAAEGFTPAGSMRVLVRCLAAGVDCGCRPADIRLVDQDGFCGLVLPGADRDLAEVALADRHPPPGRVAVAALPDAVVVDGPPLELSPVERPGAGGLMDLGRRLGVHPLRAAVALLEHGWDLEAPSFPDGVSDALRHRGVHGPARRPDEPSLAIEDDPCPRRRQARRVLRRLLHKGKIGRQYHTEFAHLARGVPPEDRAEAMQVGEALLRAGLLGDKPSVGQRHVYLRREALPQIHALIDRGETADPDLAAVWTAPAPRAG